MNRRDFSEMHDRDAWRYTLPDAVKWDTSAGCQEIIARMLEPYPRNRITIADIRSHGFVLLHSLTALYMAIKGSSGSKQVDDAAVEKGTAVGSAAKKAWRTGDGPSRAPQNQSNARRNRADAGCNGDHRYS